MTTTAPHHRLTRKELRQPDEFVSFLDATGDYLTDHLARVLAIAAGIFIVNLIGIGLHLYFEHQARAVAEAFYGASSAYDKKDFKGAEERFQTLAGEDPSTDLGRLALLYLGDVYLDDHKAAQARDALQSYLKVAEKPTFRQLALLQLGVAYEALGNAGEARKAYELAASINEGAQGRAELQLARLMVVQGDKHGAIATYQRFLREHPFGEDRATVVDALAQLGAAPAVLGQSTNTIELPAK
jgi:tetratricopeptide (TPR) repeat protein